jgi:hypothetical protein
VVFQLNDSICCLTIRDLNLGVKEKAESGFDFFAELFWITEL